MAVKDPRRRRGRPRQLWKSLEPIHEMRAWDRLRAIGLNSFRAVRTIAFCAVWEREGGTAEGVINAGHCGRRTVFNRLYECRLAGFEPELVRFVMHDDGFWEDQVLQMVRHLKDAYIEEMRPTLRRRLLRGLLGRPVWVSDLEEDISL
jgi:hypothetical protein